MATEFEVAVFEQQLRDLLALPDAPWWSIERDADVPLGVFVTLSPSSEPKERYRARFRWLDYYSAPSMKFIDVDTGSDTNPKAWPQCFGFRPGSLDACLPWTAEGQALHPEWSKSAAQRFPQVENPLEFAISMVQHALDNTYGGRQK